jgi:hypothetical protein
MSHQIARCPSCGAVLAQEPGTVSPRGATPVRPPAQAIDNLYREVARIRELAEGRESALLEEARQLRATIARLRATSRVTST